MPKPTQLDLISDATTGFDALLNNDLKSARQILSQGDSCFHLVGLGIAAFLAAALGQEDTELSQALNVLGKAESAANSSAAVKRGKEEPRTVFPHGTEYKVIVADAVIGQALVHVLTESYTEFLKAIYKLNRAYKGFTAVYKIVFPLGVKEEDSLSSIITTLNASYATKLAHNLTLGPPSGSGTSTPTSIASSSSSSIFGGWGRSKGSNNTPSSSSLNIPATRQGQGGTPLKPTRSISATALPTLKNLSTLSSNNNSLEISSSASAPNSLPGSETSSVINLGEKVSGVDLNGGVGGGGGGGTSETPPKPLWEGDALSTLVISGAAFGFGLFGLIFSLLPPKLRKLIAWFGFSNSNRSVALKLLTVSASTGDDVHGYFASLALVTYYCVVLLMSGWQNDTAYLVEQCQIVLGRVHAKFPNGTLWVLNRAKIRRMLHDTHDAIRIIEAALEKGSDFREADSLLVFEISWCYLSDSQWINAANSFKRMRELNNWSHSTYVAAAAGSLLIIPVDERSDEVKADIKKLMDELPSLFGMKRLLGEPPSTEMFIARKIECYKAKHARWVASGRLAADSKYWDVVRVTLAQELGLFWNTNGYAPPEALHNQIAILAALSPPPRFGPGSKPIPSAPSSSSLASRASKSRSPVIIPTSTDELDTVDEIATRDLLLGSLYLALGDYKTARSFLQAVLNADASITDERWVISFSTLYLAVLECKEGSAEELVAEADLKTIWKKRSRNAEKLLETMFALPEYDLKSRLESRAQMLRDEIAAKKKRVGI